MNPRPLVAAALVLSSVLCGAQPAPTPTPNIEQIRAEINGVIGVTSGVQEFRSGTYAVMHSSAGDIVVRLNRSGAPKSVENFVGLSTGQKAWVHPITRVNRSEPLYNGTLFYKVVENSLVFGGDPINRGEGDPGFSLDHEPGEKDDFSKAGVLAMQTNGPKSNGSRFMITLRGFPEYESRYTAVGFVVAGLDVVQKISNSTTKRPTIPLDPDSLYSVEILEVPVGKIARGHYAMENNKPVLTMDRGLVDDPNAVAAVPAVVDTTSGTVSASPETTGSTAKKP